MSYFWFLKSARKGFFLRFKPRRPRQPELPPRVISWLLNRSFPERHRLLFFDRTLGYLPVAQMSSFVSNQKLAVKALFHNIALIIIAASHLIE